jgi:hypothetical protein
MSAFRSGRLIVAVCAVAVLAVPTVAKAQSESLQVPIDNADVGQIDPETGVAIAPLFNPCTNEVVDIAGTVTVRSTASTGPSGIQRSTLTIVANGVGTGQVSGLLYTFSENQQLTTKLSGMEMELDTTVKLSMKGAKSLDNWTSQLKLHITINANGTATSGFTHVTGDRCNG